MICPPWPNCAAWIPGLITECFGRADRNRRRIPPDPAKSLAPCRPLNRWILRTG